MRRFETFTLADSLDAYAGLRADAPARAKTMFARKVGGHLTNDYDGSRGLRMVGLGGCKTYNSVVFYIDTDDKLEVVYAVTVLTPSGKELFDSEEALGYDRYIKAAVTVADAKAELKAAHLKQREDEDETSQYDN